MNSKNKTFADISKDIEDKYKDRFDPISLRGLKSEMKRLREAQEEVKQQMEPQPQQSQEQFRSGGLIGFGPAIDMVSNMNNLKTNGINIMGGYHDHSGSGRNQDPNVSIENPDLGFMKTNNDQSEAIAGRDPLMYASALGPLAALLMNKKDAPVSRNFINNGMDGTRTANPRQTEFSKVSMSPIERMLSERARGFSGANAQTSGGNAGTFMANELGNQANVLNAQANATMSQNQMNTSIEGMNASEQARVDAMKASEMARMEGANKFNSQLALQYDEIDAMNQGAFRTNNSNAVQSMFGTLGAIGKENTQNNMILKGLGYDSMGNYGGKGKNTPAFLGELLSKILGKKV